MGATTDPSLLEIKSLRAQISQAMDRASARGDRQEAARLFRWLADLSWALMLAEISHPSPSEARRPCND